MRILESPTVAYSTLQAAYNAAGDGNTIQCRNVTLNEDTNFNRDIEITITGGYNSDFSAQGSQATVIIGEPSLSTGKLTGDNITIKQTDPGQVPSIPSLSTAEALDTKVYLDWAEATNVDGYKEFEEWRR